MKQYRGIASNISKPFVGKVSSKSGKLFIGDCLLNIIKNDQAHNIQGKCDDYCGMETNIPKLIFHNNHNILNEYDVVLVEPSGLVTVLYEYPSLDNAIFLTDKCNCNCIMCPQPPGNSREDFIGIALNSIPLMHPNTEVIAITGGEPTIEWEGLTRVIALCRQCIPSAVVHILTNGRQLKYYAKVRELDELGEKKLTFGIPLYGDYDDLHDKHMGIHGAYWETLEGIYNLARTGLFIEIRIVITHLNYSRLDKWSEFIYRNLPFVGHIAFMGIEPTGNAIRNIEQLWIEPLDYAETLNNAVKYLRRRNMNVSIFNHQICMLPKSLWNYSCRSISGWKNIYFDECKTCELMNMCGGFFRSSNKFRSRGIAPITFN